MSAPGRIAVTLGDPRGIGPEVMIRAARAASADVRSSLLLLGPERFAPDDLAYESVGRWDGTVASAGELSARALERAVARTGRNGARAVVTGPVHKPALHAAGRTFPGQTELLRSLTGARGVGMLMAAESTRLGGPLRVLLATTHLPLREVPDRIDTPLLVQQARLLHRSLREDWGMEDPRLALCGLNPHASDGGLFGDEEERVFRPAVRTLGDEGLPVEGPLPADTVFARALEGRFDAVVAPYHDVGMAAFKTVSFGRGVNVTLGLPFVRTSPDHGTAFDIAGRGVADSGSAEEALRLAVENARRRFDTPPGAV